MILLSSGAPWSSITSRGDDDGDAEVIFIRIMINDH